jgi:uncharacterized protein YndB with AHSA1/START domain
MTTAEDRLEVTQLIPASRDRVYQAWTRHELMSWFCPEDMTVVEAEGDVRVGGEYRCVMRGADGQRHTCFGVYEDIVPDTRLAFTHSWEERDPVETHVAVDFLDRGGATKVWLTQTGFEDPDETLGHEHGWKSTLRHLAGQFPRQTRPPSVRAESAGMSRR